MITPFQIRGPRYQVHDHALIEPLLAFGDLQRRCAQSFEPRRIAIADRLAQFDEQSPELAVRPTFAGFREQFARYARHRVTPLHDVHGARMLLLQRLERLGIDARQHESHARTEPRRGFDDVEPFAEPARERRVVTNLRGLQCEHHCRENVRMVLHQAVGNAQEAQNRMSAVIARRLPIRTQPLRVRRVAPAVVKPDELVRQRRRVMRAVDEIRTHDDHRARHFLLRLEMELHELRVGFVRLPDHQPRGARSFAKRCQSVCASMNLRSTGFVGCQFCMILAPRQGFSFSIVPSTVCSPVADDVTVLPRTLWLPLALDSTVTPLIAIVPSFFSVMLASPQTSEI